MEEWEAHNNSLLSGWWNVGMGSEWGLRWHCWVCRGTVLQSYSSTWNLAGKLFCIAVIQLVIQLWMTFYTALYWRDQNCSVSYITYQVEVGNCFQYSVCTKRLKAPVWLWSRLLSMGTFVTIPSPPRGLPSHQWCLVYLRSPDISC